MRPVPSLLLLTIAVSTRSCEGFVPSSVVKRHPGLKRPRIRSIDFGGVLERRGPRARIDPLHAMSDSSSFLVRIVFLRALAFVYVVAMTVALKQNKGLMGDNGITPVRNTLYQAEVRGREKRLRRLEWRRSGAASGVPKSRPTSVWDVIARTKAYRWATEAIDRSERLTKLREIWWDRSGRIGRPMTTVLWLCKDRLHLNRWLDGIAMCGLALGSMVFVLGAANVPVLAVMWLLQRSLCTVGSPWYAYGWENQLSELIFHACFLVPILSLSAYSAVPVHPLVQWSIKWHLFRVMMGAGLIKIRSSDPKWKDLTAMKYFYETQPIPNPVTRYLHWAPMWWHKGEVLINHFVELVVPLLLIIPLLPRGLRIAGGLVQISFQMILILSGNLSFLNWLTIVPGIMCMDDAFLAPLFSSCAQSAARILAVSSQSSSVRHVLSFLYFLFIAQLSVPVVKNLLSPNQEMNKSYDPLCLVNTYGAFGVVDEQRDEIVISSTPSMNKDFQEYDFPVKPGDIYRAPRFTSPYHYRLDWQLWLTSSIGPLERSPWIFTLLLRILERDPDVMSLLSSDPWAESSEAPKYIRADLYRYEFYRPSRGERNFPYWRRKFIKRLYPRQGLASAESLRALIEQQRG